MISVKKLIDKRKIVANKYNWRLHAREKQKVPTGTWRVWLILAGRGFGKTRTGAETIRQWVASGQAKNIALIGQSEDEVKKIMIEGISGILAVHPLTEQPSYEISKGKIIWSNGAIATIFTAQNYEKLRGPQFDCAWVDELAKFRNGPEVWEQLNFALRLGQYPRIIVTTTPRPIKLLVELIAGKKDGSVHVTAGTTFENSDNLSPAFIEYMHNQYAGTYIGKQELAGEMLDRCNGVLWSYDIIEKAKLNYNDMPELIRIVVAIDPATTASHSSDETGIVVVGLDKMGISYVLADYSGKYSPTIWAEKAVQAYNEFQADCIIAEKNQGGDLVENIIRSIAQNIALRTVHATRGKYLRAEPVAALYEQYKVKHIKTANLDTLEEQMLHYNPQQPNKSPDRLDALVWAITELKFTHNKQHSPKLYKL